MTVAAIFNANYHFNASQSGLVLGISLLVGNTLGELFGGRYVSIQGDPARSSVNVPLSVTRRLITRPLQNTGGCHSPPLPLEARR